MAVAYSTLLQCLTIILLTASARIGAGSSIIKPNILGPALPHRPFVVTWNVASERCEEKYGVTLDLSDFDIVHNKDKGLRGSNLVIFYADQLGCFPTIGSNGSAICGGIPQMGDLNAHLTKAEKDISNIIPDPDFQGLAVIDWEAWHPLWDRMGWGNYLLYQNKSMEKVKADHPDWASDKVVAAAKTEYEAAARAYISFTLSLAKILRPKALWGLYLYPDCYNYDKDMKQTDLRCSNRTKQLNDEIEWVFYDSTGLYPSAYLGEWFKDNVTAMDYVAYRVLEAMRVDENRHSDRSAPIFLYHSVTYRKVPLFVDKFDLRDSIGIASLLGASGMVIWGDYNVADSVETCKNLSNYISNTLGPYSKATSDSATKCSYNTCSGNGRCVLSKYPQEGGNDERRYLNIKEAKNIMNLLYKSSYMAFDHTLLTEAFGNQYTFVCQCYDGWTGNDCSEPQVWK